MRKILFIECCGDCKGKYFIEFSSISLGKCSHSEGKPEEILHKHEMPLWCPLSNADDLMVREFPG